MRTLYNTVVVSNYLELLKGLNREDKIHLVAGLINDIALTPEAETDKTSPVNRFFGAFQSDKTAEEMIDDIRNSRKFNRQIASF